MDHQQAITRSEQRDEEATEWTYRRSNTIPMAVAQTVTPQTMSLLDGCDTLGSFPMGADLHHTSHSTSLATFQPYQHSAGFAGDSHVQESDLPEEVQHELAEADFRHTATRWEILERANALSAMPHPQATTASHSDSATNETATGYSGLYGRVSLPVDSRQVPYHYPTLNNTSSVYGLGPNVWHSQQFPQAAVHPHILEDRAQCYRHPSIIFSNAQGYDPSLPYHATYGQQPAIGLMPLTTSYHNTMVPVLSTNDQGTYGSFLNAPTERGHTQQLPLSQGVRPVPVDASELPRYTAINPIYKTTAPSAGLSWNRDTNLPADRSLSTILPEFPSFPAVDQSATTYFDAPSTTIAPIPSQTMIVLAKNCEKRVTLVKRKSCVSDGAGDIRTGSSCALDNIYFHTDPEADRQHKKSQPKRRKVTKKASWSCFGCRLSKRRCEFSTNGLCLRCKDILNEYSYHTAIPKFTCDVRTKFSDMSIFTDIPPTMLSNMEIDTNLLRSLPRPLKIDWDDEFPAQTLGGPAKPHPEAVPTVVFRILKRLHDFLDIMEPLHIRRIFLNYLEEYAIMFWSYIFSIVRWKSAILFLWPDLEDMLDLHERFLRSYHRVILATLDRMISKGNYFHAALLLNILYEGNSAMENTPRIDIPAKDHLQSCLTHHLLHVYRRISLTEWTFKKSQQPELKHWMTLNMFPHTFKMLPRRYRYGPLKPIGRMLLRTHESRLVSETSCSLGCEDAPSTKSPKRLENHCCATNAYLPVRFRTVFGLDTGTKNVVTSSMLMDMVEEAIQIYLMNFDASFREDMLELSPWTLSIALKAVLDECAISNHTRAYKITVLILSLRHSMETCIQLMSMEEFQALRDIGKKSADFRMSNQIMEPVILQWLAGEWRESEDHLKPILAVMNLDEPRQ